MLGVFAHAQAEDARRIGTPVAVAHDEGDGPQDFDGAMADVAQVAGPEFDAQGPARRVLDAAGGSCVP